MNRHKNLSLKLIRANQPDLLAISVPNKSKAPLVETDFAGADSLVKSNAALLKLEKDTSAQPGAVLRGRWIDVDLDVVDHVLEGALDYFIATPFVFGRNSKPRSHFFVRLDSEFDKRDRRFVFMSTVRQMGLNMEIRGHKDNHKLHTNLPGGQHESGEVVTWADPDTVEKALEYTPPVINTDDFARALRKAIVASVLIKKWGAGARHELALGVSGLLAKNYSAMLEKGGDPDLERVVLTKDDCESILRYVCEQAHDEEIDDRLRAMHGTWGKDNQDVVSGYGKLVAVLGEPDAKLLRVSLAGSPFMDRLEEFAELVVYYPPESSFIMLDEVKKYGIILRKPNEYMAHMPSHEIMLPGEEGKFIHVSKALRRFEMTKDVSRFEMVPDAEMLIPDSQMPGSYVLNTFRRWHADLWPDPVDRNDPDIAPILDHVMEVISNNDEGLGTWIMSWFADIAQDPTEKPGTALILVGEQGAGKSSLSGLMGGFLGAPLDTKNTFPNTFFSATEKLESVVGRFTEHLEGKLLIQLEEVINTGGKRGKDDIQAASVLKSLITKAYDQIEPKGHKIREVKSLSRFIITSNSVDRAQRIEKGDRRYTVAEVSPKRKDDMAYWSHLHELGSSPTTRSKMFRFLKDYKYKKDFVRRPYNNSARTRMQNTTLAREESEVQLNLVQWLVMREGHPFYESLQEAHWEATIPAALEYYNKVHSSALWRESWPSLISADYWERCFYKYVKEVMGVHVQFPSNDVHFLAALGSIQEQKTVYWTTRDQQQERRKRRIRIRTMPSRDRLYRWLKEHRTLPPEDDELVREYIQADEDYRFSDGKRETEF